jgi:aminomethyltransferase
MFADLYKSENVLLRESFGVRYPEKFTDPLAEYHALTTTAAMIDLCHWGVLRLTGADRVRLLNALVTNDVESLPLGRACHSGLATVKGKLVAELFVLKREDELFVLVAQGETGAVAQAIDKHIIADDVTVRDESGEFGIMAVEGPASGAVVRRLFHDDPLPDDPLRFIDTDYLGTPFTVVRNSVTGEPGYHLVVPAGGAVLIRGYLIQSGRAEDMALAGWTAWNTRRVEAGLPWWGLDVAPGEQFPKECRLDGLVSYSKGCYLGQETLARMHYRGHPNRLLMGVVTAGTDNRDLPPAESELYAPAHSSQTVGRVTSAVFSPALDKPLLLGYVRTGFAEPGTDLVLRAGKLERSVVITALPVK